jgi:hypothetical protein
MNAKRYKPQRRLRPKYSRFKQIIGSKLLWFSLLGVSLIGSIIYGVFFTPFFQIAYIQIDGNEKIATGDLYEIAEANVARNFRFFSVNNFFLLQKTHLAKSVAEEFPEIETVAVQAKLPNRVLITIQERKQVGTWCQERMLSVALEDSNEETSRSFRQCFAIDKNGVVFEEIVPEGEVILLGKRVVELGHQALDPVVLESMLEFTRRTDEFSLFKEVGLRVLSAEFFSRERAHAQISEGWEIYFSPTEQVDWQLQKAELVLAEEVPFQERPFLDYIDIRFGDQVYIKYQN